MSDESTEQLVDDIFSDLERASSRARDGKRSLDGRDASWAAGDALDHIEDARDKMLRLRRRLGFDE